MGNAAGNWPDVGSDFLLGHHQAPDRDDVDDASSVLTTDAGSGFSIADFLIGHFTCCPWSATVGTVVPSPPHHPQANRLPLYTPEERRRRDETSWTLVQAILAPIQFAVFLISLGLVIKYLTTGQGYYAATTSVIIKTAVLYTIMITGSIWEKKVFNKYLFAQPFFFEDAVSMLVMALHSAYVLVLLTDLATPRQQMIIVLAAYASYAVNAAQFLLKLRAARLEAPPPPMTALKGRAK